MANQYVTLINAIEVPAEAVDKFLNDWNEDKDCMTHQPGLIDGTLYRSLSVDAKFRFVNVACWLSENDWKAAMDAGVKHRATQGIDRIADWTKMGVTVTPAIYQEEVHYP